MTLSSKKPNFFIIGAPKCGTTALREYLSTHPKVFLSSVKGPKFFNTDFGRNLIKTWNQYTELFEGSEAYPAVGEATAEYLRSRDAVPGILAFNADAKFIVMIRNPADMFHSLYYQFRYYTHIEDANSPKEAWKLQEKRRKGKGIPASCDNPELLQYGPFCSLGEQLERLYSLVPREQVPVLFFVDFISDTKRAYHEVLSFLEVPLDARTDFPSVNERKTLRFPRALPSLLSFLSRVKRELGIQYNFGVFSFLQLSNQKKLDVPTQDPEFRQELLRYFRADIEKLGNLTGRDLSHWMLKK